MSRRPRPRVRQVTGSARLARSAAVAFAVSMLVGLTGLTGCTTGPTEEPVDTTGVTTSETSAGAASSHPSDPTSTHDPARTGDPTSSDSPPPETDPSASPTATATESSCLDRTLAEMSPDDRLGQLFMVGLVPDEAPEGVDSAIARHRVGGVIYLGGWNTGAAKVRSVSTHLQKVATGPVDLFIAADQEGGSVQRLTGPGFSTIPAALTQGRSSAADVTADAARTGRELSDSGVNVDLAPVADTVPPDATSSNEPIGRWRREYGTDVDTVSRAVTSVVDGLQSAGVVAAVKHFPGLGRVTGNTDVTATGIVDEVTTTSDDYLGPFAAGMAADVGMVMVSSAIYPKIDPDNQAMFSKAIVTDLLRDQMGWDGVVITDDVGWAKAVSRVPVGDRAVRFLAAGGDIVLTAQATQIPTMLAAVRARAETDTDFADRLTAAERRVVALKQRFGLVKCH